MGHELFFELGVVLAIAVVVSWVCKTLFRLPLIIGYILYYSVNIFIARYVALINPKAICAVSALESADAHHFYSQGVDYVIMPHYLGRKSMSELIGRCKTKKKAYGLDRMAHLKDLLQHDRVM